MSNALGPGKIEIKSVVMEMGPLETQKMSKVKKVPWHSRTVNIPTQEIKTMILKLDLPSRTKFSIYALIKEIKIVIMQKRFTFCCGSKRKALSGIFILPENSTKVENERFFNRFPPQQ